MQFPIIYLHIPKTAGTSFRVSAADYFDRKNILSDYGENSTATSSEILASLYKNNDIDKLRKTCSNKKLLSGHFTLAKYREIFPDSPVMTFFRDPVKRVISEYVHFKNHFNYPGTLPEFYQSSRFQNRQHHTLSGAKPTDLDFFGLTERYEESLELFNSRYNTKLPSSILNQGNYQGKPKFIATEEQIEEIKHLNQCDHAVYQCALDNFDHQGGDIKTAVNTASQYRGNLGGIRRNKIVGWIFERDANDPVAVTIAVNGVMRSTVVANHHRKDIASRGLHPTGLCGFEVTLDELGCISSGDNISVRTCDDQFELLHSPYVVR